MKKFPNVEDSWLVIGPDRVCSTALYTIITSMYKKASVPLTFRAWDQDTSPINLGDLLNSYTVSDLSLMNEHTKCVLCTRNMVDTTLSLCIDDPANIWKYNPIPKDDSKVEPFELDPEVMFDKYFSVRDFYRNIKSQLSPTTIVVDYSQISSDYRTIPTLIGFDPMCRLLLPPLARIPIKATRPYSNWFTNWDELQRMVSVLSTIPELDLNISL